MREIKFRGYSSGLHTWIYGDLQTPIKSNNLPFIRQLDKDEWFSVEEDSIGQYTGFKDKSGVEIYEGDILNTDTDNYGVVEFDDGSWRILPEDLVLRKVHLYSFTVCKVKVIGNIYEEKLKEDK